MVGTEIKRNRVERGITQTELSQATGIPQATICWIENNKGIVNIQQCIALADYYGISIDELIGRDFKNNNDNK